LFFLSIAASCLGILLSLLGVGATARAITKFLQAAVGSANAGASAAAPVAAQASFLATDVVTGTSLLEVVKAINVSGMMGGALWAAISKGSWWGIAWTVLSISGQIFALFSTGPVVLAYYVAMLGYSVASLVVAIADRPVGCNPAPALYGLSPNVVPAGTGVTVQLIGKRFMPGATGLWNGVSRDTSITSVTQASVQLTATDLQAPGVGSIAIANPASTAGPSAAMNVTISAADV
jgi:hypothetical protein